MKREELEFESRIAEAVRAAAGYRRMGLATAAIRREEGRSDSAESVAAALGDLLSRVDVLARPAAAGLQDGLRGVVSSLNPILGGLLRLFGGGEPAPAPALTVATRPAAARIEAGYGSGLDGYFLVDRDAGGMVRAGSGLGTPTVVVNIDAIDSRSFLERTPEIAEAVKRMILEAEGMRGLFSTVQEW